MSEINEKQFVKSSLLELLDNKDFFHHVKGPERKFVGLDNGDYTIVRVISNSKAKPITTLLH